MIRSATLALSIDHQPHLDPDALHLALQPLQDSLFGGDEQHFLWFVAGMGALAGLDDSARSPCSGG